MSYEDPHVGDIFTTVWLWQTQLFLWNGHIYELYILGVGWTGVVRHVQA